MAGTYIFTITFLTLTWTILNESLSLHTLVSGLLISGGCAIFAKHYLPLYKAAGISFIMLVTYPIYLIAKIYMAAFTTIRLIMSNSKADIIKIETRLTNDFLKVLLSHSITLTPGTISIDLTDNQITVLRLHSLNDTDTKNNAIRKMERRLQRAYR